MQDMVNRDEHGVSHGNGCRFLPRLTEMRWYCALKKESGVFLAALAHSIIVVLSIWLPLVILPLYRFPALSLLPGHRPAHEHKCAADGKRLMSMPISARIVSALRRAIPGKASIAAMACSYCFM